MERLRIGYVCVAAIAGVACQILVATKRVDARATFFSAASGLRTYVTMLMRIHYCLPDTHSLSRIVLGCRRFLLELVVCVLHVPPYASSLLGFESQRRANVYLDQFGSCVGRYSLVLNGSRPT